jgi:hypothetical protein
MVPDEESPVLEPGGLLEVYIFVVFGGHESYVE